MKRKKKKKERKEWDFDIPHKINLKMDAQFDEELIHLAQIGCVSMGIKQSRGSHRVSHVHSHDLCSSTCRQLRYLHVLAVRKRVHHKKSSHFVGYQPVRGWTRWEESELRRNWWRHSSHLSLSLYPFASHSLLTLFQELKDWDWSFCFFLYRKRRERFERGFRKKKWRLKG